MEKGKGINAEKVRAMLREEGVEVGPEEAEAILEFLQIFAKLAVSQYLMDGNS